MLFMGSSALVTCMLMASSPVAAQSTASKPAITYQIPSQPLGSALNSFAEQANVQILFDPRLMRGKRSPLLSGRYNVGEALGQLLRNSGLVANTANGDTYTISVDSRSTAADHGNDKPAEISQTSEPERFVTTEIVVTAQRRSQRLQDVPLSVVVQTGEQISKSGTLNLESLSAQVPGVNIATSPVSDFVTIRGVGSSLNLGFEQSVATFVDGVYRGRARSTRAALFDVERVEVLKGPQTTFFGNNAIAGAFNITTRKPGNALEANALASYAPATEEYVLEAGVSLPVDDTLAVRAAGRLSGMDGWIKNDNLDTDAPRIREKIGRLSVRWQPSDTIETNARFDVGRSRNEGTFYSQLLNCPPPFGAPAGACARYLAASGGEVDDELDGHTDGTQSYFDYDYWELAQTTSIDIGRNSLILTTGYFNHDYDILSDLIPVPANQGGSVVGTTSGSAGRFLEDFHQFSQEVRFQSPTGGQFEYMVGGYYAHSRLAVDGYVGIYSAPLGFFAAPVYNAASPIAGRVYNTEKAETLSAFGSLTVRPVEALRINLGARYSEVKKTASRIDQRGTAGSNPGPDNFVTTPAGEAALLPLLPIDIGDFVDPRRKDKKFMPAVSVQYDLNPNVMAYASYAKGFKAGGYSVFVSKSSFGPETVDAYELGLKSQLFDRALTLNLALFRSDYNDLQETATIPNQNGTSSSIVGNVAASRAQGIEVSAGWRLSPEFTVSSALSYLDSKYLDYQGAPCTVQQTVAAGPGASCTQDLSGKRRAFAPKYSGSVSARYQADLNSDLMLSLEGTTYFTSGFFTQPIADPFLKQSGYAKFDARIALCTADCSWEFALVGKNLSNKRTATLRQSVPGAGGTIQGLEDPSRVIGAQLSWRY